MPPHTSEYATITLPSADVAPLKRALREALNALHEDVLRDAQAIHARVGSTRSVKKYAQIVDDKGIAHCFWTGKTLHFAAPRHRSASRAATVRDDALEVLARILNSGGPRKPTVDDVSKVVPRATNRTAHFRMWEASIEFKGRVLVWDVPSNKDARHEAHESVLGRVLFKYLDRVTWTRGSGGVGVGNDEYNRESMSVGGGGNYVTFSYGPLGRGGCSGGVVRG